MASMKYIAGIALLIVLLMSCNKEDDNKNEENDLNNFFQWDIGASQPPVQDSTFSISTTADHMLLKVESDSYCPSYGILIQVIDGDLIHFEQEIYENFTDIEEYELTIDVMKDHDYDVRSASIANPDGSIICVWQGVANCKLRY